MRARRSMAQALARARASSPGILVVVGVTLHYFLGLGLRERGAQRRGHAAQCLSQVLRSQPSCARHSAQAAKTSLHGLGLLDAPWQCAWHRRCAVQRAGLCEWGGPE